MYHHQQGFTLLELLIVISIFGILCSVLIPNILNAKNKANDGAAIAYTRQCVTAIESARSVINLQLPSVTSCEDASLGQSKLTKPSSVSSSTVTIKVTEDLYTITVVSISGKIFQHNGQTIVSTGS